LETCFLLLWVGIWLCLFLTTSITTEQNKHFYVKEIGFKWTYRAFVEIFGDFTALADANSPVNYPEQGNKGPLIVQKQHDTLSMCLSCNISLEQNTYIQGTDLMSPMRRQLHAAFGKCIIILKAKNNWGNKSKAI